MASGSIVQRTTSYLVQVMQKAFCFHSTSKPCTRDTQVRPHNCFFVRLWLKPERPVWVTSPSCFSLPLVGSFVLWQPFWVFFQMLVKKTSRFYADRARHNATKHSSQFPGFVTDLRFHFSWINSQLDLPDNDDLPGLLPKISHCFLTPDVHCPNTAQHFPVFPLFAFPVIQWVRPSDCTLSETNCLA